MAKKMLSLEEIETQLVLELPDRQLMRNGDGSALPRFLYHVKPVDHLAVATAPELVGGGD
jgi:hypothetical protein